MAVPKEERRGGGERDEEGGRRSGVGGRSPTAGCAWGLDAKS